MRKAKLTGTIAKLKFPYDAFIIFDIKKLPFAIYKPGKQEWEINLSKTKIDQLSKFLHRHRFEVDSSLKTKLFELSDRKTRAEQNIVLSTSMKTSFDIEGLKFLKDYQKSGVEYIVKNKRVLLGDEPGLGKTLMSIAAIWCTKNFPCLIVCPATLKINWGREIQKWFGDQMTVTILDSKSEFTEGSDFYVINYDLLKSFEYALKKQKFKAVICDESHLLKNSKAIRTKMVRKLTKGSEMIILISGTAILNRPSELISPLTILRYFDLYFGGFKRFVFRYCDAYYDSFHHLIITGSSNLEELHTKLRSLCYIRRNKAEVLKELPAKIYNTLEIDLNNRRDYNHAKNDLIDFLRNESDFHLMNQEQQEDLLYRTESAKELVLLNKLRQMAGVGKLSAIYEWIDNFLESNDDSKLVVFAYYKEIVEKIANRYKCKFIHGGVKNEDRQIYIDDFQENRKTRLLICSLKSAGVGLTLTAANDALICEYGWTPGELRQAEDRLHRIGQLKNVNYTFALGKDSIDIDIYNLILEKEKVTDAVNAGKFTGKINETSLISDLLKIYRAGV